MGTINVVTGYQKCFYIVTFLGALFRKILKEREDIRKNLIFAGKERKYGTDIQRGRALPPRRTLHDNAVRTFAGRR
jgi:hypothetical protein